MKNAIEVATAPSTSSTKCVNLDRAHMTWRASAHKRGYMSVLFADDVELSMRIG
jgi:hypothetical protein